MSQKKFLTTAEVTHFFGIEEETVRALVESGDLKALADRGTWKYRRDDIEALISSGQLHATKEIPTVDDMDFDESMGFADIEEAGDRVDFLELDEDALAGESTMISSGPPVQTDDLKLSFTEEPEGSSSDVTVFSPSDAAGSDSDVSLSGSSADTPTLPAAPSSSDVQVVSDIGADESDQFLESLEGVEIDNLGHASLTGEDIPVEGLVLDLDDDSDASPIEPGANVAGRLELPQDLPPDTESVLGDEGLATSAGDSGLTFENTDSGLTLDTGDSGLTMDAGDSGLTLDAGDSGLTLDAGDSGLSLDGGDSGLSLEVVPDDYAPSAPVMATQRMEQLGEIDEDLDFNSGSGDSGGTRRLAVEEKFAEERAFIEDDEGPEPTSVIMVDDDDADSGDYIGTLSGAIDAGEEVDDLEVSEDLEQGFEDEDFSTAEADIVDVEDEAFSDDMVGATSGDELEDDFGAPAARIEPRQPSWGMMTAVMVICAAGLIGTNVWLMWEGVATMWSGDAPSGPAAALISTIGGIFG